MQIVCSWLAVLVGFVAAGLWWYAATIDVPINKIGSAWGTLVGVKEATAAFKLAATWNARAAMATGIAVLFQALSLIPPWR